MIGNTYEATGVKRVQLPSPPAMSRRLSCERASSDACMRAVFRRSLSISFPTFALDQTSLATARTPMRGQQRLMIWLYERDGSISFSKVVERQVT